MNSAHLSLVVVVTVADELFEGNLSIIKNSFSHTTHIYFKKRSEMMKQWEDPYNP
jgi:hypothetical protein